ncbi:MAG: T9SS type A sorting domain-containing protein [Saprospiraceae bacterium]
MKNQVTLLLTCLMIFNMHQVYSQNDTLVAPADVVISHKFKVDLTQLKDPLDTTFGKIANSIAERKDIITRDFVCYNYCAYNPCTGYFERGQLNPTWDLACRYYNNLFDTARKNSVYKLIWGKDGFVINKNGNPPTITVLDNRILNKFTNNLHGPILRVIQILDHNNLTLKDTQTIWVVDCEYSSNSTGILECIDNVEISLDSNCMVTLTADMFLEGQTYGCWQQYIVEARYWTTTGSGGLIDRDTIKKGVQLGFGDLSKEFKFTVRDPITGNSCWSHGIIKDTIPPRIIFPDTISLIPDVGTCQGIWEVPITKITDNCFQDIRYTLDINHGTILGDEFIGFKVINIPGGTNIAHIIATDLVGNKTIKKIIVNVKQILPMPICDTTVVSLNGTLTPGFNIAKIVADSIDKTVDSCHVQLWYKVIRLEALLGTKDGSHADQIISCDGLDTDDDSIRIGQQMYFDDFAIFCCNDIGKKIQIVLRAFNVNPGDGPIDPELMANPSSPLYGKFSDCITVVDVQDKSVPTLVAPPNMVVSSTFTLDINKLTQADDPTFGRIVTTLSARQRVFTIDYVCHRYCEPNNKTGYPGYVQTNQVPVPAPNQACIFYNQLFDTAHFNRKYELVWGFDGYALSSCEVKNINIVIKDLRINGLGEIQRLISVNGPNGSITNATQTIWVVDCDRLVETKDANKNYISIMTITPNPSNGDLNITVDPSIDKLLITSASGDIIRTIEIQDTKLLQINDINNGLYFIQAYGKGKFIGVDKMIVMVR